MTAGCVSYLTSENNIIDGVYSNMMLRTASLFSILYLLGRAESRLVNFEDAGALAEDMSNDAAWANGKLMNETLNALLPGVHSPMMKFMFL